MRAVRGVRAAQPCVAASGYDLSLTEPIRSRSWSKIEAISQLVEDRSDLAGGGSGAG
jgi:hypothetical protein